MGASGGQQGCRGHQGLQLKNECSIAKYSSNNQDSLLSIEHELR